jgi:alpha-L-fucosidase 2
MIDPDFLNDPRLLLSVERAIEKRMKFRRKENGGDMVFGLAQMAFVAANIGEKELVAELINRMASQYWTNSLATLHNPGNLFNMDLSGGFPAVIIRTLCYSEPGLIYLLPALPPDWKKGSIEGVLLRGQVELKSLIWDGNDISLVLNSKVKQSVTLKMPYEIETCIPREKKYKVERIPEKPEQLQLQLPANQDFALIISLKL